MFQKESNHDNQKLFVYRLHHVHILTVKKTLTILKIVEIPTSKEPLLSDLTLGEICTQLLDFFHIFLISRDPKYDVVQGLTRQHVHSVFSDNELALLHLWRKGTGLKR